MVYRSMSCSFIKLARAASTSGSCLFLSLCRAGPYRDFQHIYSHKSGDMIENCDLVIYYKIRVDDYARGTPSSWKTIIKGGFAMSHSIETCTPTNPYFTRIIDTCMIVGA